VQRDEDATAVTGALKGMKLFNSVPSAPLKVRTGSAPPGPAPVVMSAKPSSLTSPAATRTPPLKLES